MMENGFTRVTVSLAQGLGDTITLVSIFHYFTHRYVIYYYLKLPAISTDLFEENWLPGYGITLGLFLEMLLYCSIGTQITKTNERLYYIIAQSNWYTYDAYSQKTILLLLQSCMNSKELWIGQLAPLSVFTGAEIVKGIYSFYTVLVEVI